MTVTDQRRPGRVQRALSAYTMDGQGRVHVDPDALASLLVTRTYPLMDLHVRTRAEGGDGRTVDAYAAVFNVESEIQDQDGHYLERNDPHAFDKTLASRQGRDVFCLYNHGRTLLGTPSDMWSVPLGEVLDVRADSKGLLTSTRYNTDDASQRILEAIRSGSVKGMSYTGVFLQSDPAPDSRFGEYMPNERGDLTVVTRKEIALIEYGPTPIPAFAEAAIVGVRTREVIRMTGKKKYSDDSGDDENDTIDSGGPAKKPSPGSATNDTIDSGGPAKKPKNDDQPDDDDTIDTNEKKPKKNRGKKKPPAEADDTSIMARSDEDDEDESSRSGDGDGEESERAGGSWDGHAAMAKAASSSDPAAALNSICAGKRSGDPKTEAAHALPHHDTPGGPPNPKGVAAALGRLDQTEGLTNKAEARAHLEAHQRALSGGKPGTKETSSSGRDPAAGKSTSREAGNGTGTSRNTGPQAHPGTQGRDNTRSKNMGDRMTVSERHERVAEIKNRLLEIDREYTGEALPESTRSEWDDLLAEKLVHERSIKDAESRRSLLEQIAGDDDKSEGVEDRAGYGQEPAARSAGFADRQGKSGPAFKRDYSYVWDVQGLRQRAKSVDELPQLYRDCAMRAVEISAFPTKLLSRENAQERIERLLYEVDNERGDLARRLLVTGSPLYDRAFGKMLAAQSVNGLTTEESRALALGTDSAGGFAVPFQLDPTILLTSNGAINPLRQLARVEQITGKEWDGVTTQGVTVSRVAEATEASDGTPTLAQPTVRTTRVQGFIPFNIELDVSWGALRAQMTRLLMDAKDVEEASSFITGNGTAPNANGVITTLATTSYVLTAATATLAIADLYSLENAMAPRFRQQSAYLASKTIYNKFRVLFQAQASAAGDSWVRPSAGTPASFNGYDAYEASAMATATTSNSLVLLQGDFQQFLIVDRVGMGIELIPHLFGASSRFPTGQRGILAIWFNNSKVLVDNAFRLLKML